MTMRFPKINVFFLLSLFITFQSYALQTEQWNGKEYAKHSKSQEKDANALLKNIPLKGDENILDIGCGDGRFTLLLATQYTKGDVIGIDPSDSMMNKANSLKKPQNLTFLKEKAETYSLPKRFDLIVSIHTLHWVKDQKQALSNMLNHLKPGGKIYFILAPSKEGLPFDRALKSTLKKWHKEFAHFENNQYFYDMETYRKLLVDAGFHVNNISYTFNEKKYQNQTELANWIKQWLPHYKYLSKDKNELFLQDLMDAYLTETKSEKDQTISWGEYVLQVEAVKMPA